MYDSIQASSLVQTRTQCNTESSFLCLFQVVRLSVYPLTTKSVRILFQLFLPSRTVTFNVKMHIVDATLYHWFGVPGFFEITGVRLFSGALLTNDVEGLRSLERRNGKPNDALSYSRKPKLSNDFRSLRTPACCVFEYCLP